jgi:hypothetical protein
VLPKTQLFFARERYQGDVSASLDRDGNFPLVSGAVAGYAPGKDFAPLGNEEPQRLDVFVINEGRFVHAEPAYFLSDRESSFPVAPRSFIFPVPVSIARIRWPI